MIVAKNWIRQIGLALVLAIGAVPFLLLATPGHSFTGDMIAGALSTEERQVEILGMDHALGDKMNIEEVRVLDDDGVWATLKDVEVDYQLGELFSFRLTLTRFSAGEVHVLRLPKQAEATPGQEAGYALPERLVPSPFGAVDIQAIDIQEIILDEAVLGTKRRLALTGKLNLNNDPLTTTGELELVSLDREAPILLADWRIAPQEDSFALNLQIDEAGEGLFADLIDIPRRPAFQAQIVTSGPLSALKAELDIALDGGKAVEGELVLGLEGQDQAVQATLNGELAPLMPDVLVPFFAGKSQLDLQITRRADGTLVIEQADFASALTQLTAAGTYAPTQVDLTLEGQFGDPATEVVFSLSEQAEMRLGEVRFAARLAGPSDAAEVNFEARVGQVETAQASLRDAEFTLTSAQFDLNRFQGELVLRARTEAAQWEHPQIEPLLDGPLAVQTTLDLSSERIRFSDLRVQNAALVAQGQGEFEFASQHLTAELVAEIQGEDRAFYGPLFANGAGNIEARLVRDGQRLAAERLVVASENLNADVRAELNADGLAASGQVRLAQLEAFDPRLSGQARFDLNASGTLLDPQLELKLTSESVGIDGEPLEDLQGTLQGGLTEGIQLDLSARYRQSPVSINAAYKQQDDGRQFLRDLIVTVPGGRAEGALTIGADGLLDGQFNLDFADLKNFAPLLLMDELAGSLQGTLVLDAQDGQQSAALNAQAEELSYATIVAQNADIDIRVNDAFGAPVIDGASQIEVLRVANERLRDVRFSVASENGAYPFEALADYQDDTLRLAGTGQLGEAGFRASLTALNGRYKNIPVSLAEPATFAQQADGFAIELPALRVGAGRVQAEGTVDERLDLDVRVTDFPLDLVENLVATGQDINGSLSGTATITGTPAAPKVDYQYRVQRFSIAVSRTNQLPALNLSGTGELFDNRLVMNNTISGGGASARANGSLNLVSNALDIAVNGQLPFEYLAQPLSRAGIRLVGTAAVNAQVSGSASAPRFDGQVTTSSAQLLDVASKISVSNIAATIRLNNDQARVVELTGTVGGGGQLSISGQTSLRNGDNWSSDYDISVREGAYEDGLLSTEFDATLKLTGPLAIGGTISGIANIDQAIITIPEEFAANVSPVEIQHKGASPAVRQQAAELAPKPPSRGNGGGLNLDIQVNAPRQIYVRGRGVDAELGGRLRILGSTGNPSPSGDINLIRGRVDVLTKRFEFDVGQAVFRGTMDPSLNFRASTRSDGYIYSILVQGYASAPEFSFQSTPNLPQDEVVANLFFGKSLGELSPLQLAQLASAIAAMNGSDSGPGLLDRLRTLTGVDNIDIRTNDEGETTLGIGTYLNDRTYLNVEKGTKAADDKVTIDLEITESLKARGETSGDGNTEAGIFYEKDY